MKAHYTRGLALAVGVWAAVGWVNPSALAQDDRDEWQQPDRVMADLALKPGATVADIGAGQGYFTLRMAKAVGETGKVCATEVNDDYLATIRDAARRDGLANVTTVLSEPTDTKLPDACADAVLICDVLHEVAKEQRAALVASIAKAVKPGGYLFIVDYRKMHEVPFDPYEILVPRDDLVKFATDPGLVLDAEYHYLYYQVFLRFRKPPNL